VKVFLQKFLYALVLGFAGFGLFSGWTAAKEFLSKNSVEETKVVQKISPVKPDFAHNHPVYSMHSKERTADDFTFFDILNDPAMKKMVGLNGQPISSTPVRLKSPPQKPAKQSPVLLKINSKVKSKIVQVASPRTNLPAQSLPVKKLKSAAVVSGRYTVQVSSFKDMKYAEKLASKLEKKGYPTFIKSVQLSNGQIWYRVNIGKYPDRDSAKSFAQMLQAKETLKTMVIPLSG